MQKFGFTSAVKTHPLASLRKKTSDGATSTEALASSNTENHQGPAPQVMEKNSSQKNYGCFKQVGHEKFKRVANCHRHCLCDVLCDGMHVIAPAVLVLH